MSSVEDNFSCSSEVIFTVIVEDIGVGIGAKTGFGQVGSGQALFEGVGLTMMDSDKRLRYLSRNPTLNFVAMPLSSSSTQIMRGTT